MAVRPVSVVNSVRSVRRICLHLPHPGNVLISLRHNLLKSRVLVARRDGVDTSISGAERILEHSSRRFAHVVRGLLEAIQVLLRSHLLHNVDRVSRVSGRQIVLHLIPDTLSAVEVPPGRRSGACKCSLTRAVDLVEPNVHRLLCLLERRGPHRSPLPLGLELGLSVMAVRAVSVQLSVLAVVDHIPRQNCLRQELISLCHHRGDSRSLVAKGQRVNTSPLRARRVVQQVRGRTLPCVFIWPLPEGVVDHNLPKALVLPLESINPHRDGAGDVRLPRASNSLARES
mmetsp:Transcript_4188/g.17786  ORF Transcript_4188/g.17786 Transcript_4188/m.17786 type:complete len:286 (-) Transcript_4188:197-1054(-)